MRSDAGMAKEFPVSSGSQHRKKVWIDFDFVILFKSIVFKINYFKYFTVEEVELQQTSYNAVHNKLTYILL